MFTDGIIHGDTMTRVRSLVSKNGLPFEIQPSIKGDPRRCKKFAEELTEIWDDICPEQQLGPAECDSIMMGRFVGWNKWTYEDGKFIPRMRHLPSVGLFLMDGREQWNYIDGDGVNWEITPGDGTWVSHEPFGERSHLKGAVRTLGLIWLMRHMTYRDYVRFCEKHGMPILAIKEPFFATDDVETNDSGLSDVGSEFYRQFKRLGSESVLRLPQAQNLEEGGFDAKWLEPIGQSYNAFDNFLKETRSIITTTLLGVDLTTIPQGMGGDSATWSERIRVEFLASEAEALCTTIRNHIFKPYIRFNYGEEFEESAPWPKWDTRPQPDMTARAGTLTAAAAAIAALDAQGFKTEDVLEEFKLEYDPEKRKKVEEQREAEAKLALAPQGPGGGAKPAKSGGS